MKASITFNFDGTVRMTLLADTVAERRMLLIITERPRAVMVQRDTGHHTTPPEWVGFDLRETPSETGS